MTGTNDLPLFASAILAAVAASFTAFGFGRRRYAGWKWWIGAAWLTAAGTMAAAWLPAPLGLALAAPLLQQWPLTTLVGLRRFHARQALPGNERSDLLLLTASSMFACFGTWLLPPESRWLLGLSNIAVHLYAAGVLFLGPAEPEDLPVQGLGTAMALVAFAPGLAALHGTDLLQPARALAPAIGVRSLAAALGIIVLAFVAVSLVCGRTERQLRESRRRLRTLANLDALTQVPNRRHFQELAEQALRQDPPGSAVLLLFDVDHFKQLNDHLGHAAGDRALCLVSGSVQDHLRALDAAGRHGGDEFVLLLRRTTPHDAVRVAQRIVNDVQTNAKTAQLPLLTLSFGLVQVRQGEALDSAMRRADQALYEAKRQGRARVVIAEGDELEPVFGDSQRLGLTPS